MKLSIFLMVLLPMYLNFKACCSDITNDYYHPGIPFTNNSKDTIMVHHWFYPYMLSYPNEIKDYLEKDYIIKPGQTNTYALDILIGSWEEYFAESSMHGKDTVWVYVFNANKIDKKSDNVDAAFLARYGITLKDMIELNWQLSYPPDSIISFTDNPDLAKDPVNYGEL